MCHFHLKFLLHSTENHQFRAEGWFLHNMLLRSAPIHRITSFERGIPGEIKEKIKLWFTKSLWFRLLTCEHFGC